MSEQFEQHTLEYFFKQYKITKTDKKAILLPVLTGTVFDYNEHVVRFQKENEEYKKKQIVESINELLQKIDRIMKGEEEFSLS